MSSKALPLNKKFSLRNWGHLEVVNDIVLDVPVFMGHTSRILLINFKQVIRKIVFNIWSREVCDVGLELEVRIPFIPSKECW